MSDIPAFEDTVSASELPPDTPLPPGLPWASVGVMVDSFARVQAMVVALRESIDQGGSVQLGGNASPESLASLRETLDEVCRKRWGEALNWSETIESGAPVWVGSVPEPQEFSRPVPPSCAACGQALEWTDSRLRLGHDGWEHQCGEAQAGYFSAEKGES